jgi:hypothetical protein
MRNPEWFYHCNQVWADHPDIRYLQMLRGNPADPLRQQLAEAVKRHGRSETIYRQLERVTRAQLQREMAAT